MIMSVAPESASAHPLIGVLALRGGAWGHVSRSSSARYASPIDHSDSSAMAQRPDTLQKGTVAQCRIMLPVGMALDNS